VCVTTSRYLPPGEVWTKFKGPPRRERCVRAAVGLGLLRVLRRRRIRGHLLPHRHPAPEAMQQRKGGNGHHRHSHQKVVRWRDFSAILFFYFLLFLSLVARSTRRARSLSNHPISTQNFFFASHALNSTN
jgi:hypothetical protein